MNKFTYPQRLLLFAVNLAVAVWVLPFLLSTELRFLGSGTDPLGFFSKPFGWMQGVWYGAAVVLSGAVVALLEDNRNSANIKLLSFLFSSIYLCVLCILFTFLVLVSGWASIPGALLISTLSLTLMCIPILIAALMAWGLNWLILTRWTH